MAKVGRKRNEVRDAYVERFGLLTHSPRQLLKVNFLKQLSECKSDDTRRLLLGISEKLEGPINES